MRSDGFFITGIGVVFWFGAQDEIAQAGNMLL